LSKGTNELDVALAERYLATLQAGVAPLEAQIAASQHVIAVLIGQFPEDLAKELARPGKLPGLPAQLPPGLPIDLLRRRPDIHAAERQLAAATARIGVATADLFPRVVVSGALGGQGGPSSSSAIPITFIGAAGPAVYWPLLDFGTLDAIVDITELQAHELLVGYKQTIITAVQQVDDAIAAYAAAQQRLKDLDRALVAARRSTKLATERYDRGLTDYLNVLDAERQEFDLEVQYVSTLQSAAEQLVTLYKGLAAAGSFMNSYRRSSSPSPQSSRLRDVCWRRTRATRAMIIGMLPMAIEPGQNAPLGRAVIGGLMFATCATLILVPALFSIAHGRERPEKIAATPLSSAAPA
jgi:NodT family efflux transporter outer membrane factor (OMF) lipoprotein